MLTNILDIIEEKCIWNINSQNIFLLHKQSKIKYYNT